MRPDRLRAATRPNRLRTAAGPPHTARVARLVKPTVRLQDSFLEALREFHAVGEREHLDLEELEDPDEFAWLVRQLREDAVPSRWPRTSNGRVAATNLWWVEGRTFLGQLAIRHTLATEFLRDYGGHIGYDVRPSARRQGHARRMLAAALPLAASLGIDPALVTCDEENAPSRRVIERNGGVLSDLRDGKLRFWVPTG